MRHRETIRRDLESGFTIIEFLTVALLSSILLTAVVNSFTQLTRVSHDHEIKVIAQLQAQSVIDMLAPEIRMLGNGVPFHQANFLIAQQTLTNNTVTQPIVVSGTTANQIKFRLNQTGETYILTADFNPISSSSVTLTSVSKIYVGDQVYITNATVGEDDGFWGTVAGISSAAKTITFASGTQFSPSSIFTKGSLLEVVPVITYTSATNYGGIKRDDGLGALTLVPSGQFTLQYLDINGNPLTLPLLATEADPFPASAIQNVRSLKMTISVRSSSKLYSGQYYVATAEQVVGIRNFNFKY